MCTDQIFDALIVGGSTAGLTAALLLGRSLRRVLVLDADQPANRQTPHSHGLFTRDGETPAQLLAIARQQLQAYPTVQLHTATVVQATRTGENFQLTTTTGHQFIGRKVLLATGVRDELLPLPGFAECWGISVLHCPYCHGYEVHGQPLGVRGNGDLGFEFARMIQHWSPDLWLFTDGPATFSSEQRQHLLVRGIQLVETPLTAVEHDAGQLRSLRLADDTCVPLTALFAHVPFTLPHELHTQLGCTLTEQQLIQVDAFGRTTVPGVFAAGDNATRLRQLVVASAQGSTAAAFLNRELIEADF